MRATRRLRPAAAVAPIALVLALSSCGGDPLTTSSAPRSIAAESTSPTTTTPPIASTSAPATTTSSSTTAAPAARAPVPTTTAPPPSTLPVVERSGADVGPTTVVGDPVGIRIPSLDVDSPIVPTGVNPDGSVAVPSSADVAGWFEPGPRPGERGPSVVMAHVDSARTGPGVFFRLRDIRAGALVSIDTTEGEIDFVVERIEQHAKDEFPTDDVYGPVPAAELRLVTCGGEFDRSVRSYDDNIVVYLKRATS